ncbi:phosphoribosyltransferase family protein [Streptomyces megasporus]|uniref:phosphoribosyltransferase family protein n=1 Tax=Streptomyces megasporus TaxID=44060 RepID=UPI0004E1C362|nr:phosphoribosyltransferase family protein [Streptomyces megasporus]
MDARDDRDGLRRRLREAFAWRGPENRADLSSWWADPSLLAALGPALAGLHPRERITTVLAPESTGFLLGPPTAIALGAGFVEMRRDFGEEETGDRVLLRNTPPDYSGRTVEWGVRRRLLRSGLRVLFVDDWAATSATAQAARRLVEDSGSTWVGAAVLVDATASAARRDLRLHGLLRERELG